MLESVKTVSIGISDKRAEFSTKTKTDPALFCPHPAALSRVSLRCGARPACLPSHLHQSAQPDTDRQPPAPQQHPNIHPQRHSFAPLLPHHRVWSQDLPHMNSGHHQSFQAPSTSQTKEHSCHTLSIIKDDLTSVTPSVPCVCVSTHCFFLLICHFVLWDCLFVLLPWEF